MIDFLTFALVAFALASPRLINPIWGNARPRRDGLGPARFSMKALACAPAKRNCTERQSSCESIRSLDLSPS
jgi:hypothetical protein